MSTWIYLTCEDHDPPLIAGDESGQHLYDLPNIRKDIADRAALIAAWEAEDGSFADLEYFTQRSAWFLRHHPKCRIGIIDEYGVRYPVEDES